MNVPHRHYYQVRPSDVGHTIIRCMDPHCTDTRTVSIEPDFGPMMSADIGRRFVWTDPQVVQMETRMQAYCRMEGIA